MKIIIKTKLGTLVEYTTEETLDKVEMPYMCVGYGFNGSSMASQENLEKYWNLVDKILLENNLTHDDYQTLVEIVE